MREFSRSQRAALLKPVVAATLLMVGTNTWTYATTRYCVTSHALSEASSGTEEWLIAQGFQVDLEEPDVETSLAKQAAGKELLGRIGTAGGMYNWWNDAIPYWGMGTLLIVVGCLVPFVKARNEREGGRNCHQ